MINDEEYDDGNDANTKEEEIVLSRCLSGDTCWHGFTTTLQAPIVIIIITIIIIIVIIIIAIIIIIMIIVTSLAPPCNLMESKFNIIVATNKKV